MVKRIFAIIGIVVGSVAAFVGAVVGVMAAMGKFKTPIVKPKSLEFETTEMRVVPKSPTLGDVLSDAYSFSIVATNSSYSEKVNRRDCKLWFDKGENLIELGKVEDGEWKVLSSDRYSRYEVKCNETLYFKLKDYNSSITDGVAVLNARSDAGQVETKTPLTICVDRIIESVFVNKEVDETTTIQQNPITHRKELTQNITIGTDVRLDFDYIINPDYSLKPISTEVAKEIELYYDDKNVEGYVKITKDSIKDESLNSIFGYDEETNKIYLASHAIGEFEFKVAVFPTYQDKDIYEANLEDGVENIYNRLDNMLVTNLRISVVNSNVLQVNMINPGVVLSLYSQNDYLVLNNADSLTATNLGVSMLNESGETFVRFDEIDFNLININIRDEAPVFKTLSGDQELRNINQLIVNGTLTIGNFELSNIWLSTNMVIIDCLKNYGGYDYYSQNGAAIAVLDEGKEIIEIKTLNSGSYLDFYINSTSGNTLLNDSSKIEIEAPTGEGKNKTWRVITKNTMKDENVRIGILVINGEGSFVPDSFYSSAPVEIFATELIADLTSNEYRLNVSYVIKEDRVEIEGDEIPVLTTTDELGLVSVKTTSGYNAVVFVTPKLEDGEYGVEVVESATFTFDDKEYVLVGYIEDKDNRFVNSVKSTGLVAESVNIYLLNLFNGYNQTAEDLINSLIFGEVDDEIVVKDTDLSNLGKLTFDVISISPYFILNKDLVNTELDDTFKTDDGTNYYAYAETEHTLTLSSDAGDMLKNVYNQLQLESHFADYFKIVLASSGVTTNSASIQSVILTEGKNIVVNFTTQTENAQNIKIVFNFDDEIIVESKSFSIKSNKPENIVLQTTGNELDRVVLYETKEDARENDKSYISIELGYDDGTTLSYTVHNSENNVDSPLNPFVFNSVVTSDTSRTGIGFKDAEYKIDTIVSYSSVNENIFTLSINNTTNEYDITVYRTGEAVLEVTINDVSRYILIKITSNISLETKNFQNPVIYTTGNELSEFVNFSDESMPLNNTLIQFVNLVCTNYGAGMITVSGDNETGFVFTDAGGVEVLRISFIEEDSTSEEDSEETSTDEEDIIEETFDSEEETDEEDTVVVGNWKFTRKNSIHIPISIRFGLYSVYGEIETIQITFSSTTYAEFNEDYKLGDSGIYVVYQNKQPATLIDLNNTSTSSSPFMRVHSPEQTTTELEIDGITTDVLPTTLGQHTIYVTVGSIKIGPFDFSVYPNIIATSEATSIANEAGLLSVFTLQSYDAGEWKTSSKTNYTDVPSNLDVEITGDIATYISYSSDSKTFSVNDIKEISSSLSGKVKLKYVEGDFSLDLCEIDITLTSSKTATIDYGEKTDHVFTYISGRTYTSPITANGNPTSIEFYDGETKLFDEVPLTSSGEFNVPFITADYSNLKLVFKFADDYTYTTTLHQEDAPEFNLKAYIPTPNEEITPAYSGTDYNLIQGVFDKDSLIDDTQIKSIEISDISENVLVNQSQLTLGDIKYLKVEETDDIFADNVTFTEISGDKLKFYVTYLITYSNNKTYEYEVEFTLHNRQQITLTSPIQGLSFENQSFVFYNVQDALNLIPQAQESSNKIYTISSMDYEPMLIYSVTTKTASIDFTEGKYVNRVEVENKKIEGQASDDKNSTTPTISLVAYSNRGSFANYASQVRNTLSNSTTGYSFTFPQATYSTQGYLIFKVHTKSGNFAYYCIYVYCEGESAGTNVNRQKLNANNVANIDYELPSDPDDFASIVGGYSDLKTNLGWAWNDNIELYLLDAKYNVDNSNVADAQDVNGMLQGLLAKKYEKVNDTLVPTFTNYATITLAVVYNNGNKVYNFGTFNINVTPSTVEEVNDDRFTTTEGIKGVYYRTIEANEYNNTNLTISNPFDGLALDSANIIDSHLSDKIVEISDKNVVIKARTTEDLRFDVKYTFSSGLVIIVHYTYEKTEVKDAEEDKSITVGGFDADSATFNNKIAIADIIGDNFNGTIKIDGNELNLSGNSVLSGSISKDDVIISNTYDDKHYLTFSQSIEDKTVTLTIEFVGLIDSNGNNKTVTYTFNVKQGLYITTVSQEGVTSSTRLPTALAPLTPLDNRYESKTGSQLKVTKSGTGTDIDIYTFGGYVIYALQGSNLQFAFSNVVEDNGNGLAPTNYITTGLSVNEHAATINSTGSIDFVHLAEEKDINAVLTVTKNSVAYVNSTRTIYITVAKTYTVIEAKYVQPFADHENVKEGYTINNLFDDIKGKVKLYDQSNNEITNFDLALMQFNNVNNPNFITFSATGSSNASLSETDGVTSVQFDQVDSNKPSLIHMSNKAGITNVEYKFYILNSNKTDDLILNSANYATGTITGENPWDYVSLLLDDDIDSSNEYSSGDLLVGSLLDDTCNVLTLERIGNVTVKTTTDSNYTPTPIKYTVTNGVSSGLDFNLGEDFNGYAFKISFGSYVVYVLYNSGTSAVYARFVRTAGADKINEAHLKLTFTGTTSDFTKEIVFCNYQINELYATSYDSVYGRYVIDITKKIEVADNLKFSLVDTDDGLYTFDATNSLLTLSNVGQTQTRAIKFNVKSGDYIVKQAVYNVIVNRNLVFVVNGEELSEVTGNDEIALESTFKLNLTETKAGATSTSKPTQFPIYVPINYSGNTADGMKLVLQLHAPHRSNLSESTLISNGLSLVRMEFADDNIEGIEKFIEIDNTNHALKFYSDFTGDLTLNLICETEFGNYSTTWVISVQGLLNFANVGASSATKLSSSGSPYNSNDTINIINSSNLSGTGVVLDIGEFKYTESTSGSETIRTYDDVTRKFEYVIVENTAVNRASTNEAVFENNEEYQQTYTSATTAKLQTFYPIRLPYVPATDNSSNTYYIVVFKLTFDYLDQQKFDEQDEVYKHYDVIKYVAYYVINYASIDVYSEDVTTDTTTTTLYSEVVTVEQRVDSTSSNYLDMFYYQETYTVGSDKWIACCVKDETDGNIYDVLYQDATSPTYYYYDDGYYYNNKDKDCATERYIIDTNNNKLKGSSRVSIEDPWGDESDVGTITESSTDMNYAYNDTTNDKYYYSVFKSSFGNVHSFADFIKSVYSIKLGDVEFALAYINNGRWGIDLCVTKSGALTTGTNKLFSNELICDLQVLQTTDSGIYEVTKTISKYDSTTGRGFKLTSEHKIEHKYILLRDIVGENIAGAYADYEIIGVTDKNSASLDKTVFGGTIQSTEDNMLVVGDQYFYISSIMIKDISTTLSGSYYELKKIYYVISRPVGKTDLVTPNYAGSINIDTYIVKGNSINLTNVFNNYSGEFTDSSGVSPITSGITVSGLDSTLSYSGTTLTYSGSINKTFDITATISGKQVPLRIRFVLNTTTE